MVQLNELNKQKIVKCTECHTKILCGLCGKKLCHTVRANCSVTPYYIAGRAYIICPDCYIKSHGTLEHKDRIVI
ncbi:MAG: hypothetical protein KJ737_20320 [Proteobacteria bacterium]|nr:hypothetical protein [Pseudomonadota bacterium]